MTRWTASASEPDGAPSGRLRVLVVAYACEPDRGSEPGAGWEWAMAAAERHQVWLVTSRVHAGPVRAALAERWPPGLENVHFLEDEIGRVPHPRGPGTYQLRYRRWQRQARPFLADLHAEHRFDLGHHLTWAVDWQPAAVASVPGLPYVWGPVGGATSTSLRMARWLGPRGLLTDLTREVASRTSRRFVADRVARGAALVLAQNRDVQRRFRRSGEVALAPNPAIRLPAGFIPVPTPRVGSRRSAVFVGHLHAWKGIRLAVDTIARAEGWDLDVYGRGPAEDAARRSVARLGLAERVRFHGVRPREEALQALAGADAMLFPSIHDSAPWAVAEALTLGTPVVSLDRGGPPDLHRGVAGVAVATDRRAPEALARALETLPAVGPVDWWRAERLPEEVDRYYRRAVAAS